MRQLMTALRTTLALAVLFTLTGLHSKPHSPDSSGDGGGRPRFNPSMMPKRIGPAQQHGIERAEEGRPKAPGDQGGDPAPGRANPWDDPRFADARYDMKRFGEMGEGTMDKVWDGDGRGNGDHKPSSTEPGKTKFPPGTTKEQVAAWFKDIAVNPDSAPQARPHGDGWVVTGTRGGITCVVTLDKDGSISGGHPVSGEGVTTNPMPPDN